MNQDLANLSTDLRRISYWIYEGQFELAKQFLEQAHKKYALLKPQIECYDNIWEEIEKIAALKDGRLKAAERALTASLILLHQAQE